MMKTVLLAVAVAATVVAGAAAAVTPKPWMWSPAKMGKRLVAADPFVWQEAYIKTAVCAGRSKAVAGRYTAFRCAITFGNANARYDGVVLTRVLPVGSGKFCVVANAEGKALPHQEGTQGITVAPGRACPS